MGPLPTINPILEINALLELRQLVDAIYLDDRVVDYLLNIVQATREPKLFQIPIEGLLEFGASSSSYIISQTGIKGASPPGRPLFCYSTRFKRYRTPYFTSSTSPFL